MSRATYLALEFVEQIRCAVSACALPLEKLGLFCKVRFGPFKAHQFCFLRVGAIGIFVQRTFRAGRHYGQVQHCRPRSNRASSTMSAPGVPPSRFVSQDELNEEEDRREKELKEVYEW